MQEEISKVEKEFGQAIIKNDPEAIERFLADDWIIIDPDGGIVDQSRFLGVIRSGTLSHEVMDSDDVRVRIYGDAATGSALNEPLSIEGVGEGACSAATAASTLQAEFYLTALHWPPTGSPTSP
jgi:Domain of unknown function (DUF4440)